MPDVTVRNETQNNLNVAFRFVAPTNWTNTLLAGDSWTTHLASTPYKVEARLDHENNRFSADNSLAVATDISGGCLAGAASVTLGALSVGGVTSGAGLAAAGPLMQHAGQAGERFAQSADGMVISVGVCIPFNNNLKTYAIRFDETSGYSLWDVDNNSKL